MFKHVGVQYFLEWLREKCKADKVSEHGIHLEIAQGKHFFWRMEKYKCVGLCKKTINKLLA